MRSVVRSTLEGRPRTEWAGAAWACVGALLRTAGMSLPNQWERRAWERRPVQNECVSTLDLGHFPTVR
jgi:hypothetical protein